MSVDVREHMQFFAKRREKFMAQMTGGVAIIPAAHEVVRSNDSNFTFRQNSTFYYLTGFNEPDAVALLMPNHPEHKYVLFVRPKDKEREIWDGFRFGPEGAKSEFKADAAYPLDKIDEELPKYLENQSRMYFRFGRDHAFDQRVHKWLGAVQAKVRQGINSPSEFIDPAEIVHEMRMFKDELCVSAMRRAAQISMGAHRHGMKVTKPGMNEGQLQAEMEYFCRMRGSQSMAYGSIVAGGDNANVLHYHENNQALRDGDLVLVDLGCELDVYASDITRTWPVNGRFSREQRIIYNLVLESQARALAASRAGTTHRRIHEIATLTLAEGLIELGVLKGDAEKHMRVAIGDDKETKFPEDQPVLRDFYMHGTGHWIGLDVHDCGWYRQGNDWRVLKPGMCMTIEPGLYFARNNPKAPDRFKGIGIRIEDDVMITAGEPEVLTIGLPRTAEEVESCCAKG